MSLNVLMSAYACEPNKGSEPGVGWNLALEMAKYHNVWVLTRANNRIAIKEWLYEKPVNNLSFIFYDMPHSLLWLKKGEIGVQIYYYLWQAGAYFVARQKHTEIRFDIAHHVTFVKYWTPSFLSLLPLPFLWGPVGGGESTPKEFLKEFGAYGMLYEKIRGIAKWVGERDPLVRYTAKKSKLSIATTPETAKRLEILGASRIEILSQCGFGENHPDYLNNFNTSRKEKIAFISIGNLLHLKGFHFGLKAFAKANLPDCEFWIIGDGPERNRLQCLSHSLGIKDRVKFFGRLTQHETLKKLGMCDVLVHPSLHESGGFACMEAMATGKPVICLDLGGPAMQVTKETGFKLSANNPDQVVRDMVKAMKVLAKDPSLRDQMGHAGRNLARQNYTWEHKGKVFNRYYTEIIKEQNGSYRTEVANPDSWGLDKIQKALGGDNDQQVKNNKS
jgi:glycosyltransferase involved in cell wall biosynthesis